MGTCTLDSVKDFLSEVALQPHALSGNNYIFTISGQFPISFPKQKLTELALWDELNIECQIVPTCAPRYDVFGLLQPPKPRRSKMITLPADLFGVMGHFT